jgi:hypothetical protein
MAPLGYCHACKIDSAGLQAASAFSSRGNLTGRISVVVTPPLLFDQDERLRISQAGRNYQFPAGFQLLDQRGRNQVGCCRHDHLVEGGVLGPAMIAIRKTIMAMSIVSVDCPYSQQSTESLTSLNVRTFEKARAQLSSPSKVKRTVRLFTCR